eukprot:TRINITY_DN17798_c0_g1_i1.p1 TRINITY_DN17798_c0_g1~~TRINITY_DN17798_c0_g1_i1.p1  ORF type:complete len:338 (+),score=88.20 TRINITY_DN17798_c0_g1_i1:147-1160(+)
MEVEEARKQFEIENEFQIVPTEELRVLFTPPDRTYSKFISEKPWMKDVHYFKRVRVSCVSLLKMLMHARSGGTIEVMGNMLGKAIGDTIYILDSYELPVEATETRVHTQEETYPFQVAYSQLNDEVGRGDVVVGWYHSHPGYGPWLSGIDVQTQMLQQQVGPNVAIVIDPIQTMSSGKVYIGAFRTYPQGHKEAESISHEYEAIPLDKIKDFGVHHDRYYELKIEYFKTPYEKELFELLWTRYWKSTLSAAPLLSGSHHFMSRLKDVARKARLAKMDPHRSRMAAGFFSRDRSELSKVGVDGSKLETEYLHGLLQDTMKYHLFCEGGELSRTEEKKE